ncbi:MBL fold metallo-hydrolase [Exilibacterium tricleocarpae]|uniref:MBL fold metallo-hydrolase n=1 Tax=Exilibacterium tricleocarpae TaxID=2591008 RepID=A0A545U832_9GAMM|nr:MBL fold metallo-hydrolase [Exilibacterium tricleocarpae]TQV85618.1 MBL fold metallo-hydrolase [Exilibacterium tricleocarpae]
MQFASLGSGSRGNATLVRSGDDCVLIDCGFTVKETQRRLARLGVAAEQLAAVLVTHEHSDHLSGVAPLARRYRLPVYMTPGTYKARDLGELPALELIHGYQSFSVGSLDVTPVAVPHDAREPAQFVVQAAGKRLGVLTDLGSITPHVENHYADCDALVLEANHDPGMLAAGPYPVSLKRRVGGPWGHLSNLQTAGFLARLERRRLQHLVVAHISQKNNSLALAQAALTDKISGIARVHYACQDQGFDWLSIE